MFFIGNLFIYMEPLEPGLQCVRWISRNSSAKNCFSESVHHAILHLPHPEKNFVLTVLNIWGERNQLQRLDVEWPQGVADSDSRHWQIVRSRVCTLHRLKLTDANSLLALDIFRHGSSPFSRAQRAYRKPLRIPDSIG